MGYIPFVGNIANFGAACHYYKEGQASEGHIKMCETVIGTFLDITAFGSFTTGVTMIKSGGTKAYLAGTQVVAQDIAARTIMRMGAYDALRRFLNPPDAFKL